MPSLLGHFIDHGLELYDQKVCQLSLSIEQQE